ncbi:MAG: glycerate kinase [Nitriliruptoraceae bacterium]
MRVLIAPDGFKGTLTAPAAAAAIAAGWHRARPDDVLDLLPLADGGDGLCEALAAEDDRWLDLEVVGPLGRPVQARVLLRSDDTAVVASAAACGLDLVPASERTPMATTTYGVGQLLLAVVAAGARHVLVGLGGSATVDAGLGALTALGLRLRVADGSGLKIGGGEIHRLASIERTWVPDLSAVTFELLADVTTPLAEAAEVFGPQKGASPSEVAHLTAALDHVADVVERDLAGGRRLRSVPGTGAAGGLGFGLAAALDARFTAGAARVAGLVGLEAALAAADLVVTGEGRLDATSLEGKVVGHVLERARTYDTEVVAVAGQVAAGADAPLADAEPAAPQGPGRDAYADVETAAHRLAERSGRR